MVSPSSAFDQQHLVYTYPLIYYGSSKCGLIFSHDHRESRPGFGSWILLVRVLNIDFLLDTQKKNFLPFCKHIFSPACTLHTHAKI